MDWVEGDFEWDQAKELVNVVKHGVDFTAAQDVFDDPRRVFAHDQGHSMQEPRFFVLVRWPARF